MCESKKYTGLRFTIIALLFILQNVAALNYRLDSNVIPSSYDIWIRPYIDQKDGNKQYTFDGEVKIVLHAVIENVKQITLHKDFMEISAATLHQNNNVVQQIPTSELSFEKETDKLTINLQQPLVVNQNYTLQLNYTGQIRNGQLGVFHANYLDEKGNTKTIVLTQAQRIDARTILPCFDEPAFKAAFRLRISRPKEYMSLFNTRLINSEVDSNATDRYIDTFDWSPKMSSYLIGFMMAEYVKRGNDDDDVVLYSRPEYYNFTVFSYNYALRTVEAYNKYTNIPYKTLGNVILQKASSPKFPHNGMENWGLVLYRDNVLVNEPLYSDGWNDKQSTIKTLAHETSHMWFGNSVTFSWWSYFWLNEAFARYYEYYMAHVIAPQYQLDEQFVVRQVHLIFGTDALNSTQPLTTPENLVQTPSQIASKFSAITYAKGACIIRMIRNLMGYNNFDLAIQEYLKEFHLKNVVPSDLFKHLKKHWPKDQFVDLDIFFQDWTEKVGFPVLTVKLSDNKKQVLVQQKRFLNNSNDGSDPNIKYTIPITYTTDVEKNFKNLKPKTFFNATAESLSLMLDEPIKWIILNVQQSNYHRVNYASDLLNAIRKALTEPDHSGIHVINRAQILDDLFNFASIGMKDYASVLEFAEYLAHEVDFSPWYAAFKGLQRISQRLTVQEQKNFGIFILNITAKVYKKLGFESENDTILDVFNRDQVIYWTCKYGDESCNKGAQAMVNKAHMTTNQPNADFRETLYCSAVRFGVLEFYNIVDNWYKTENRSSEKELILRALGCTKHHYEIHFARILTDEIPQQYKQLTLKPLYAENPENVSPVFDLITRTYNRLQEQLGSWSALADVISDCANYFTTKEQKKSLDDFITEHGTEFGDSLATLERASRTVATNLKWAEDNLVNLNKYLLHRNSASFKSLSLILLLIGIILSLFQ